MISSVAPEIKPSYSDARKTTAGHIIGATGLTQGNSGDRRLDSRLGHVGAMNEVPKIDPRRHRIHAHPPRTQVAGRDRVQVKIAPLAAA